MPLEVHFDCAGSQNLGVRGGCLSDCALLVVPRAFSDMVVTFRGMRRGNLVFWWSKVDFLQVQGIGAAWLTVTRVGKCIGWPISMSSRGGSGFQVFRCSVLLQSFPRQHS